MDLALRSNHPARASREKLRHKGARRGRAASGGSATPPNWEGATKATMWVLEWGRAAEGGVPKSPKMLPPRSSHISSQVDGGDTARPGPCGVPPARLEGTRSPTPDRAITLASGGGGTAHGSATTGVPAPWLSPALGGLVPVAWPQRHTGVQGHKRGSTLPQPHSAQPHASLGEGAEPPREPLGGGWEQPWCSPPRPSPAPFTSPQTKARVDQGLIGSMGAADAPPQQQPATCLWGHRGRIQHRPGGG